MRSLMNRCEADFRETEDILQARFIIRAAWFFLLTFLGSFRDEETPCVLRKPFIEHNQISLKHSTHMCASKVGRAYHAVTCLRLLS